MAMHGQVGTAGARYDDINPPLAERIMQPQQQFELALQHRAGIERHAVNEQVDIAAVARIVGARAEQEQPRIGPEFGRHGCRNQAAFVVRQAHGDFLTGDLAVDWRDGGGVGGCQSREI